MLTKCAFFGAGLHEKKEGHLLGRTVHWTDHDLTAGRTIIRREGVTDEWRVRSMTTFQSERSIDDVEQAGSIRFTAETMLNLYSR